MEYYDNAAMYVQLYMRVLLMVSIWVGSMLMYMPMLFFVDMVMDSIEAYKGWKMRIIPRLIIAAVVSVLIISAIDCMELCTR